MAERINPYKPLLEIDLNSDGTNQEQTDQYYQEIAQRFLPQDERPTASGENAQNLVKDFVSQLAQIHGVDGLAFIKEPSGKSEPCSTAIILTDLGFRNPRAGDIVDAVAISHSKLHEDLGSGFYTGIRLGDTSKKSVYELFESVRELERKGEADLLALVRINRGPQI